MDMPLPSKLYSLGHLWSPWTLMLEEDGSQSLVIEDAGETVVYENISKLYEKGRHLNHALIEEPSTHRVVLLDPALRKM